MNPFTPYITFYKADVANLAHKVTSYSIKKYNMLYKWAKKFKTGNFRKYKLACKRRLWQTSGWTWWLHNQLNQTYLANYDIASHKRNPPVLIVPLKLFNGIYLIGRVHSYRYPGVLYSITISRDPHNWVALQEILWSSSTGIFEAALPLSHNTVWPKKIHESLHHFLWNLYKVFFMKDRYSISTNQITVFVTSRI